METEVFVYVDLAGTPHLAGRLWARVRKDRESATFEHDPGWLEYADRFSLEPALTLGPGPFHTPSGKSGEGSASLDLAMSVVEYFELDEDEAYRIAAEVGQATTTWREEAAHLGATRAEVDRMASAFEHEDLRAALSIS